MTARRSPLLLLALLLAAAVATRVVYVLALDVPAFDPWRHLALIRNLRDGAGFTLFDGQPYIWYGPLWYRLCALFPAQVGPEWIAASFSALAAPGVFLLAWERERAVTLVPAFVAGALTALAGPVVAFTCHYGQEGMALFLVVAGLLLGKARRGPVFALTAGIVFGVGVTLRMNFAFLVFLFLPFLRDRKRTIALVVGIILPLAVVWFRNHQVISSHPFVFTWDGLATRSSDYGLLSTLVVQMHPAVQEGLSLLHESIVPIPEWIRDKQGYHPDWTVFLACGVAALIACRRWHLILAGGMTLGYFLFFDASKSSHFFRLYLPLFPVFFLAAGEAVARLRVADRKYVRVAAWAPAVLMVLAGAKSLVPPAMTPLEALLPPPGLLDGERYMVNSGFYRPSCLILDRPDVAFIGLPLDPAQFDEFHRAFPRYRTILQGPNGVQADLFRHLLSRGDFTAERPVANRYRLPFRLLREK